jgi:biopolymer transport protein ExbD
MAMNIGSSESLHGDPEVMIEMNTTPLIDVMLVLLVMLIITIPIQLHSVNVDMPAASAANQTVPLLKSMPVAKWFGTAWLFLIELI